MNPSIILLSSNIPITNNILKVNYYFNCEHITGIHKLYKKSSLSEDSYNTPYLCWQAEEHLVNNTPNYFAELTFVEPISKELVIDEIWVSLTHRYNKGYKVKSKIVDKTMYLYIKSIIKEKLV